MSSKMTPKRKNQITSADDPIVPVTPVTSTEPSKALRRVRLTPATLRDSKRASCHQKSLNLYEKERTAPSNSPLSVFNFPASPAVTAPEGKRRRHDNSTASTVKKTRRNDKSRNAEIKVYYREVVFDGAEFSAGDDVYVKRREEDSSDNEDPEYEECSVCFQPAGAQILIECDDCLNGFQLKCLTPPLKEERSLSVWQISKQP